MEIGNKYSVEDQVLFDQYTIVKGDVLEIVPDVWRATIGTRLIMSNKRGFRFAADKEHTTKLIESGKLKLIKAITTTGELA